MFRLFFCVMFAALFVFGCSSFEADPVSVVSVSPPEGSTIELQETIVVEFTDVPENLHVYTRLNADSSYKNVYGYESSRSGQIVTIREPFSNLQYFPEFSKTEFTKIIEGVELHLFWGRKEEYTHLLKFSVEPRWADGVLTITVGNYQYSGELFSAMEDRYIVMSRSIETYLGFPMSSTKRSVDVAVVKLLDVGFSQPVTIEKIRKRFSELGYRPLTLEEAFELRRQFTDQPSDDVFMNRFTILLSEEGMQHLRACVDRNTDFGALIGPCDENDDKDEEIEKIPGTLQIFNARGALSLNWQRPGRGLRVLWVPEGTLFDPSSLLHSFACVIEK